MTAKTTENSRALKFIWWKSALSNMCAGTRLVASRIALSEMSKPNRYLNPFWSRYSRRNPGPQPMSRILSRSLFKGLMKFSMFGCSARNCRWAVLTNGSPKVWYAFCESWLMKLTGSIVLVAFCDRFDNQYSREEFDRQVLESIEWN